MRATSTLNKFKTIAQKWRPRPLEPVEPQFPIYPRLREQFKQRVVLSDGSSIVFNSTLPKEVLIMAQDTRIHPIWNPHNKTNLSDEGGILKEAIDYVSDTIGGSFVTVKHNNFKKVTYFMFYELEESQKIIKAPINHFARLAKTASIGNNNFELFSLNKIDVFIECNITPTWNNITTALKTTPNHKASGIDVNHFARLAKTASIGNNNFELFSLNKIDVFIECNITPTWNNITTALKTTPNHKASGIDVSVPGLDKKISGLLFADDAVILAKSADELQKSFDILTEWCKQWGMDVYNKKCGIIAINCSTDTTYKIQNQLIPMPATQCKPLQQVVDAATQTLAKCGKSAAIIRLRQELSLTGLNIKTAVARTRAFIK
ncbi:hypothetical protein BB561_000393 [Smittium simulii]|uniref:Uncharacterized protein n=1 Tax=Smittium simulii TaxID=133385 RepID=A0A2T9YZE9_9FUNG|nr:hypothetical protein BB561_000393 [Smittium simulii]